MRVITDQKTLIKDYYFQIRVLCKARHRQTKLRGSLNALRSILFGAMQRVSVNFKIHNRFTYCLKS